MRDVKDLMMSLSNLTSESVRHLRKTAEDPPRVSVLDLISAVTGGSNNCSTVYARLREQFPDVATTTSLFKFGGRGQRDTPITCVKGAVLIVMLLPGRAAATVRKQAASTLVRYLGGDLSLVDEIARNHLDRQYLDEDAPARLFGQQVESDSIKRKREEVTLAELDLQLCEQAGALKCRRIGNVQYCLSALEAVGEVCDRDRLRAGDMVRTIAFGGSVSSAPEDREVCVRQVINEAGRSRESPALDMKVGKLAKKLVLAVNPDFCFPKKQIYANGQLIDCNMWLQSQRQYIDDALAQL